MSNINNEKQSSLNTITKDLQKLQKQFTTIQESVHQLTVKGVIHAYRFQDNEGLLAILEGLSDFKGFARVESVAYFLRVIAGFSVSYNEKEGSWSVKFSKNKESEVYPQIKFTRDSNHLNNWVKNEKYRFWLIAPVELKLLKLPTDLSKVVVGAEIQMARALLAGTATLDDVKEACLKMVDDVEKLQNDKKVKDWVKSYFEQQSKQQIEEALESTKVEFIGSDSIDSAINSLPVENFTSMTDGSQTVAIIMH